MTRQSVILNVFGGLECRSECLTNMQEALGSIPSKEKREKKGEKGRKERKEKARELNTTKQQHTSDPKHYMQ